MASIQELEVVESEVRPARALQTRPIKFLNRTLFRMAEVCVNQLIAGQLADANTGVGFPGYYDRLEYNAFLDSFSAEMNYLKQQYSESEQFGPPVPSGQLKSRLVLLVPSASEKAKYRGQVWKSVHLPIFNIVEILESHNDIEKASEVEDWKIIEDAFAASLSARDFYFDKKKISYPQRQKFKGSNPPAQYQMEEFFEPGPDQVETGVKNAVQLGEEKKA